MIARLHVKERVHEMSDLSDALVAKAQESLAGAMSELANNRYNNVANRAYYACYQAAVAALDLAGIRPPGGKEEWGHGFVQAQFVGLLINRRKMYPADLRDALSQTMRMRVRADYQRAPVNEPQALRAVARARAMVTAVEEGTRR